MLKSLIYLTPTAAVLCSVYLAVAGNGAWGWFLITAIVLYLFGAAAASPPMGRSFRPAPPTRAPKGPAPTPPPGR